MNEFDVIAKYFEPLTKGRLEAADLKDDAAIFNLPSNHELVVTTDTLVGGIHFFPDDPYDQIAQKALRVSLSDLAAMGALPHAYTLNLSVPKTLVNDEFFKVFCRGLEFDQNKYNLFLAGGDTTRTDGPLTISITAYGMIPSGLRLSRANAEVGDICAVTGTVGDAFLGLKASSDSFNISDEDRDYLLSRYRLPEPRIQLSQALERYAKSCIDMSDGFLADLGHMCRYSDVLLKTSVSTVPLSEHARNVCRDKGIALTDLLSGGDDYELIIAVSDENWDGLKKQADKLGIPLTKIGHFEPPSPDYDPVCLTDENAIPILIESHGWAHF